MIEQYSTVVVIPANTVLMSQNEYSREAMLIIEGKVEVSYDGAVVATLGSGDLVGEIGLDRPPYQRTANVETITDCEMAVMSPTEFASLKHFQPRFAQFVEKTIEERNS